MMLVKTTIQGGQAMTIVPIGKIKLQVQLGEKRAEYIEQIGIELGRTIQGTVTSSLEALLVEERERLMNRPFNKRRKRIADQETKQGHCNRCKSRNVCDYRRNGYRQRGLDTRWGHVQHNVPQVECVCGGAVHVEWQLLRDRQRLWDDIEVDIRAEYGWGLSLREIKMR
jgi:hypothetical protein